MGNIIVDIALPFRLSPGIEMAQNNPSRQKATKGIGGEQTADWRQTLKFFKPDPFCHTDVSCEAATAEVAVFMRPCGLPAHEARRNKNPYQAGSNRALLEIKRSIWRKLALRIRKERRFEP